MKVGLVEDVTFVSQNNRDYEKAIKPVSRNLFNTIDQSGCVSKVSDLLALIKCWLDKNLGIELPSSVRVSLRSDSLWLRVWYTYPMLGWVKFLRVGIAKRNNGKYNSKEMKSTSIASEVLQDTGIVCLSWNFPCQKLSTKLGTLQIVLTSVFTLENFGWRLST